ncbi:MAG: carboxypeptidase-like regulatory domain-containing protein [Pyrinomonadaceae bacterium]
MLKIALSVILPLTFFFNGGSTDVVTATDKQAADGSTGTLQKMIVANGSVSMKVNIDRLNRGAGAKGSRVSELRFAATEGAFFKILVYNNELRGPMPSSMDIIPHNSADLPSKLNASYQNLVVEYMPFGSDYEMTIRDGKTGFTFFNIEGLETAFTPENNSFGIVGGRLIVSKEFAAAMGRPSDTGAYVGDISMNATMRAIEITQIVNGDVKSEVLPPSNDPDAGTTPGPDVVVGDVYNLSQVGSQVGTQVGLAFATDSCNFGVVPLNWFAMPQVDHPVIPMNLYRMSGGASNNERFEQVGQSSLKHAFTALQNNTCSLGCVANPNGTALGTGCSDPYSVSNNSSQSSLGSRAWVNPFSGSYTSSANSHTGHSHVGPSHRLLTEVADLIPAQNPGATYFAEGQYVTPHEYAWCQSNPGQCNMYNNVSYRQYNVSNSASPFSFSVVGNTVRQKFALNAWTGATIVELKPAAGTDGVAYIGYKVTNTSPGVWHYEYAVYNQNLDRAIQLFSVATGAGATISNIGFHAPPQHPGWANDGTVGSAGFSSTAWAQSQAGGAMTWNSQTFAENQNANAIRWGTLYNFRFDSNRPPTTANATIGFFKTGSPIVVQIQGPSTANVAVSGRVTAAGGRGVTNATVTIETAGGSVIGTGITSRNGNYVINNIPPGAMYTIRVSARRYTFTANTMQISDNVTNADFVAN